MTSFFKIFVLVVCLLGSYPLMASSSFFSNFFNKSFSSTEETLIPMEDIKRFMDVIKQVKRHYVEPITHDKLFENAIRGALAKLDPHSNYLDAQELKELTTVTLGQFGGLGIEIAPSEKGGIRVVSPLDGTPAYKAKIKAGDLIVKIDGQPVKDMTLRDALNKMRGPKGSKVVLTIVRPKAEKPLQFEITRDTIKMQTVKSKMLEKGYGYVRVAFFMDPTASDMIKALKKLKVDAGGRLKGLVLDLRNNPGGLLDSAIEITDQFLDAQYLKNKKIVYTKGRIPQINSEALASKYDMLSGTPMIVLINEGSASGSEIVAGALQDHKRAIILGTRSFGKGSVQTVIPVDEHSAIKLTTGLYYTPAGRSIQAEGIQPDVWVEDRRVEKSEAQKESLKGKESIEDTEKESSFEEDTSLADDGAKAKHKPQKEGKQENQVKDLVNKDFQLYQALNLLKGLAATKGK